jgi:hypothetical protein
MSTWKIAEAKEQFSRLVREAEKEPQLIYNRDRLVAAVVEPGLLEQCRRWKESQEGRSLAERFGELRRLCEEEDYALPTSPRRDRRNPFARPVRRGAR